MGISSYDYRVYYRYDENNSPIGFDLIKDGTTSTYTYVKNIQGDIVGIINDSTGAQVVAYTYDAWGNLTDMYGTAAETVGKYNSLRYRGYYYDSETGYYYLQSRYYDPSYKRFINADEPELITDLTKESVLGGNLFAYCGNNAVNRLDPSGKGALTNVLNALSTAINGIIQIVEAIIRSATKELKSFVKAVKALSKKQIKHVKNLKALIKDASRLKRRLKIIAYAILFVSVLPLIIKAKIKGLALVEAFIEITVSFLAIGLSWIVSKVMSFLGVVGWIISAVVDTIGESMIRLYFTAKRIKKMANSVYNAINSKKSTPKKVFKALFSAIVS